MTKRKKQKQRVARLAAEAAAAAVAEEVRAAGMDVGRGGEIDFIGAVARRTGLSEVSPKEDNRPRFPNGFMDERNTRSRQGGHDWHDVDPEADFRRNWAANDSQESSRLARTFPGNGRGFCGDSFSQAPPAGFVPFNVRTMGPAPLPRRSDAAFARENDGWGEDIGALRPASRNSGVHYSSRGVAKFGDGPIEAGVTPRDYHYGVGSDNFAPQQQRRRQQEDAQEHWWPKSQTRTHSRYELHSQTRRGPRPQAQFDPNSQTRYRSPNQSRYKPQPRVRNGPEPQARYDPQLGSSSSQQQINREWHPAIGSEGLDDGTDSGGWIHSPNPKRKRANKSNLSQRQDMLDRHAVDDRDPTSGVRGHQEDSRWWVKRGDTAQRQEEWSYAGSAGDSDYAAAVADNAVVSGAAIGGSEDDVEEDGVPSAGWDGSRQLREQIGRFHHGYHQEGVVEGDWRWSERSNGLHNGEVVKVDHSAIPLGNVDHGADGRSGDGGSGAMNSVNLPMSFSSESSFDWKEQSDARGHEHDQRFVNGVGSRRAFDVHQPREGMGTINQELKPEPWKQGEDWPGNYHAAAMAADVHSAARPRAAGDSIDAQSVSTISARDSASYPGSTGEIFNRGSKNMPRMASTVQVTGKTSDQASTLPAGKSSVQGRTGQGHVAAAKSISLKSAEDREREEQLWARLQNPRQTKPPSPQPPSLPPPPPFSPQPTNHPPLQDNFAEVQETMGIAEVSLSVAVPDAASAYPPVANRGSFGTKGNVSEIYTGIRENMNIDEVFPNIPAHSVASAVPPVADRGYFRSMGDASAKHTQVRETVDIVEVSPNVPMYDAASLIPPVVDRGSLGTKGDVSAKSSEVREAVDMADVSRNIPVHNIASASPPVADRGSLDTKGDEPESKITTTGTTSAVFVTATASATRRVSGRSGSDQDAQRKRAALRKWRSASHEIALVLVGAANLPRKVCTKVGKMPGAVWVDRHELSDPCSLPLEVKAVLAKVLAERMAPCGSCDQNENGRDHLLLITFTSSDAKMAAVRNLGELGVDTTDFNNSLRVQVEQARAIPPPPPLSPPPPPPPPSPKKRPVESLPRTTQAPPEVTEVALKDSSLCPAATLKPELTNSEAKAMDDKGSPSKTVASKRVKEAREKALKGLQEERRIAAAKAAAALAEKHTTEKVAAAHDEKKAVEKARTSDESNMCLKADSEKTRNTKRSGSGQGAPVVGKKQPLARASDAALQGRIRVESSPEGTGVKGPESAVKALDQSKISTTVLNSNTARDKLTAKVARAQTATTLVPAKSVVAGTILKAPVGLRPRRPDALGIGKAAAATAVTSIPALKQRDSRVMEISGTRSTSPRVTQARLSPSPPVPAMVARKIGGDRAAMTNVALGPRGLSPTRRGGKRVGTPTGNAERIPLPMKSLGKRLMVTLPSGPPDPTLRNWRYGFCSEYFRLMDKDPKTGEPLPGCDPSKNSSYTGVLPSSEVVLDGLREQVKQRRAADAAEAARVSATGAAVPDKSVSEKSGLPKSNKNSDSDTGSAGVQATRAVPEARGKTPPPVDGNGALVVMSQGEGGEKEKLSGQEMSRAVAGLSSSVRGSSVGQARVQQDDKSKRKSRIREAEEELRSLQEVKIPRVMKALTDVSQQRRKLEALATSVAAKSAEANARLARDSRDAALALMEELRARREASQRQQRGKQKRKPQQELASLSGKVSGGINAGTGEVPSRPSKHSPSDTDPCP